jgi:alpha-L-fucosidase 2
MLLQSHAGELSLLPALPMAWPQGRVTGLRARGGFEIDIAWRDRRLSGAVIRAIRAGPCRLRVQGPVNIVVDGTIIPFEEREQGLICFEAEVGCSYQVIPS